MDAMVAQEDDVFEAMKDVVDPELGINVVERVPVSYSIGYGCLRGARTRSPMTAGRC